LRRFVAGTPRLRYQNESERVRMGHNRIKYLLVRRIGISRLLLNLGSHSFLVKKRVGILLDHQALLVLGHGHRTNAGARIITERHRATVKPKAGRVGDVVTGSSQNGS
jgi:hypothetical protein